MAVASADAAWTTTAVTADAYFLALQPHAMWAAGASPASNEDYQVVSGYVDVAFENRSAAALTVYVLEFLMEPGEASPTNGLQDAAYLAKKFYKKQMLGITTKSIPVNFGAVIRLPLSQASVLGRSGYTYNIYWYLADGAAVNLCYRRIIGGKMKWDRIV